MEPFGTEADVAVVFELHLRFQRLPWTAESVTGFVRALLLVRSVVSVRCDAADPDGFLDVTLTDGRVLEYGYRVRPAE